MPSAASSGLSTAATTVTSSTTATSPACAACKYQRKKCSKTCLLAPYFPHDRPKQFINCHKLFGVSNITKAIKALEEPSRGLAMNNIIMEAEMRARDPVRGTYGVACNLMQQIETTKAELYVVHQQLALLRGRSQETQEIYHGYGDLLEQQQYVMNPQNLHDKYIENQKPVVKVTQNHDVKLEQEGKSNFRFVQCIL